MSKVDDEVRRLKREVDSLTRSLRDVDDRFRDIRKACEDSASSQRRELDHLRKDVVDQRIRDKTEIREALSTGVRDVDDLKRQVASLSSNASYDYGPAKQKKEKQHHSDVTGTSKSWGSYIPIGNPFSSSSSSSSTDLLKAEVRSLTTFVYEMNKTVEDMKHEHNLMTLERGKFESRIDEIANQTNLKFMELSAQITGLKAKQHQQGLALEEVKNEMSIMKMSQKHDVERLQETVQDKSEDKVTASKEANAKIKKLQEQVHKMELDMARLDAEWKCTQEVYTRSHEQSGADDRPHFYSKQGTPTHSSKHPKNKPDPNKLDVYIEVINMSANMNHGTGGVSKHCIRVSKSRLPTLSDLMNEFAGLALLKSDYGRVLNSWDTLRNDGYALYWEGNLADEDMRLLDEENMKGVFQEVTEESSVTFKLIKD